MEKNVSELIDDKDVVRILEDYLITHSINAFNELEQESSKNLNIEVEFIRDKNNNEYRLSNNPNDLHNDPYTTGNFSIEKIPTKENLRAYKFDINKSLNKEIEKCIYFMMAKNIVGENHNKSDYIQEKIEKSLEAIAQKKLIIDICDNTLENGFDEIWVQKRNLALKRKNFFDKELWQQMSDNEKFSTVRDVVLRSADLDKENIQSKENEFKETNKSAQEIESFRLNIKDNFQPWVDDIVDRINKYHKESSKEDSFLDKTKQKINIETKKEKKLKILYNDIDELINNTINSVITERACTNLLNEKQLYNLLHTITKEDIKRVISPYDFEDGRGGNTPPSPGTRFHV